MARCIDAERLSKELIWECDNDKSCNRNIYYKLLELIEKQEVLTKIDDTIKLPCNIGDTVYRITKHHGVWHILPRVVLSITYMKDSRGNDKWEIFTTTNDILGETVFVNDDEAYDKVKTLKRRER